MDSDEGDDDIGRDFAKLSRIAQNNGYREGIQHQSELISQECFDSGYSIGSKTGIALGLYNGILSSIEKITCPKTTETAEAAETAKRDVSFDNAKKHCVMCADESLIEASLDNLQKVQGAANESLVALLSQKYSKPLQEMGVDLETLNKIINKDSKVS